MDSFYNKKINFLNQYVKNNGLISESFISTVKLDLKYQRIQELIEPGPNGLIPIMLKYQFELSGITLLLVYQHICSFINTLNHNSFYTSNDL